MYIYHKTYHKSSYICECENRSLLRKGCQRGQKSVLTELDWANPRQSSETAVHSSGSPCGFQVRFFPDFIVITETASGWASFLCPQVLIDGENCGSIVGANRASVLMSGWLGKAAHCQCDFSEDSASSWSSRLPSV